MNILIVVPRRFTIWTPCIGYIGRPAGEWRIECTHFGSPAIIAASLTIPVQAETEFPPNFDKIGAYVIINKTLLDGKHPAWVYYSWNNLGGIARITVPDNNFCLVSVRSKADMDIVNVRSISWFERGSDDWTNAVQAYVVAFEKLTSTMQRRHTSLAPECR